MKTILLALFLASTSHAETVDETNVLRLQLADAQADALAAKIEAAKHELAVLQRAASTARAALQQKYKLGDGDNFDGDTRVIKRAPKPSVTPPKKDVKK